MKFELGDSVIVNQGVKEPDYEDFEISGWQGRIVKIDTKSDNNNVLITIEWDSLTLEQIPSNFIKQSEEEGYEWRKMTLYDSELTKSKPRDSKEDVIRNQNQLADKHYWDSFGDEGIRISKVLEKINPNDEMKCLKKWVEYLNEKLTFPIHAIVTDSENNKTIKRGNKVLIKSLPHIVEIYGIIASIVQDGKRFQFPLCDLRVIDETKADFQLIEDYRTWFANR